jgi:uncharacterized membrane protein
MQDVTSEIRARTQPTLLDLGVAVVGGVAGVYAILRKLSGVMVGVAIATALVPPLSTIGFGLATWRLDFAINATLLFLTNTLAIAFAATLVARLNRFGPSLSPRQTAMQVTGIMVMLGILSAPLALSLNGIVREVAARSAVQTVLGGLLEKEDRIDTLTVRIEGDRVAIEGVVLVGRYRPALSRQLSAQARSRLGRSVTADLVQLRLQSDTAIQMEDRVNQRLVALERGDAESAAVLSELTAGGLVERAAITLDFQTRRVIVARDREAEGNDVGPEKDRIMAEVQRRHPAWFVTSIAAPPADVQDDSSR